MKIKKTILMATLSLAICGCSNQENGNPLLGTFDTPHNIAPFQEITIDNYREGMLLGMEEPEEYGQQHIDLEK